MVEQLTKTSWEVVYEQGVEKFQTGRQKKLNN
jgi:hypothetical protein